MVINGFPLTVINKSSQLTTCDGCTVEADEEGGYKPPVVCIPYLTGLSEDIRRVYRRFSIRTIFKAGPTLRSYLMRVKDRVPTSMKSSVVYCVPCSCGKVYIGETVSKLETKMKEHEDACKKGTTKKSAIGEHAWTTNHTINVTMTLFLKNYFRDAPLSSSTVIRHHLDWSANNYITFVA